MHWSHYLYSALMILPWIIVSSLLFIVIAGSFARKGEREELKLWRRHVRSVEEEAL